MVVGLFSTGRCTNDCFICGVAGENRFKFYHIGKDCKEKLALKNLFNSFHKGIDICLTGGDPLRNLDAMDVLCEDRSKHNNIVMNPLTFLCNELNKPAGMITNKEANDLLKRVAVEGICKDNQKIVKSLAKINYLNVSNGNMQTPSPSLMKIAMIYYSENIRPELKKIKKGLNWYNKFRPSNGLSDDDYGGDGKFDLEGLVDSSNGVYCVGRFRSYVENTGKVSRAVRFANKRKKKTFRCTKSDGVELFFKKDKGSISLHRILCCYPGNSHYVSFDTGITVDQLAEANGKEVKELLGAAWRKFWPSPCSKLLNGETYEENFGNYVDYAQDCIEGKTGKRMDLVKETYTTNNKGVAVPCEVCSTTSLMLKRAGVSPKEWQDYLEVHK